MASWRTWAFSIPLHGELREALAALKAVRGDKARADHPVVYSTATIDGDRLVVSNVHYFTWRSDTDFDQRWEQRSYNLSHVTDVDLIMSYWAGEAIAHTIVSFGFDDGQASACKRLPLQRCGAHCRAPDRRIILQVVGNPDAAVIVPPRSSGVPSETAENAPTPRDRHLQAIAEHGRMGWQKASGYNWRALVTQ